MPSDGVAGLRRTGRRNRGLVVSIAASLLLIATHLTGAVRDHAQQLLTRQHVHQLLGHLCQDAPRLVDEVVPRIIRPALLQQVLSRLLYERVPIRDLETILETLGDYGERTQNPTLLTESVRLALSRTICQQHRDAAGVLQVITLGSAVEDVLAVGIDYDDRQQMICLSDTVTQTIATGLSAVVHDVAHTSGQPVVICSPEVRAALRRICAGSLPDTPILSLPEVSQDTNVQPVGELSVDLFQETLIGA